MVRTGSSLPVCPVPVAYGTDQIALGDLRQQSGVGYGPFEGHADVEFFNARIPVVEIHRPCWVPISAVHARLVFHVIDENPLPFSKSFFRIPCILSLAILAIRCGPTTLSEVKLTDWLARLALTAMPDFIVHTFCV